MLELVLGVGLAATVYYDGRYRRIPNFITLPLILFGLIYNTVHFGLGGLGNALLGCILGLGILFLPFILGGVGAGDVKLLAAIGCLKGVQFLLGSFLYGAIIGGIWACLILSRQGSLLLSLKSIGWNTMAFLSRTKVGLVPLKTLADGKEWGFPYGIAIGLGALLALIRGNPF